MRPLAFAVADSARRSTPIGAALFAMLAASIAGCGTTKVTGTPRTGTEQVLLTNAWDDALRQVDFGPLKDVPVYVDPAHVQAADQGWVVSSIKRALLTNGAMLRAKPELAQCIVEASVGAYGTDEYNWLLGVPQTTIPAVMPGIPSGTIPEMPFVKKSQQHAVAKLALYAYDRNTGRVVWNPPPVLATASAKDIFIGGVGPIQSGSIRHNHRRVGVNIPMISDPVPATTGPSDSKQGGGANDLPGAAMPLPPVLSDLKKSPPPLTPTPAPAK